MWKSTEGLSDPGDPKDPVQGLNRTEESLGVPSRSPKGLPRKAEGSVLEAEESALKTRRRHRGEGEGEARGASKQTEAAFLLPFPFIPCKRQACQLPPLAPRVGLLSSVNPFTATPRTVLILIP